MGFLTKITVTALMMGAISGNSVSDSGPWWWVLIASLLAGVAAGMTEAGKKITLAAYEGLLSFLKRAVGPPPSDEVANRRCLLASVRAFWITEVLEKSLQGAAALELGLQEQSDAVMKPWQEFAPKTHQLTPVRPSDTRITPVYDRAMGGLLILGTPGSGKTTLLLQLADDLLKRAEQDKEHPLPVVFNLSSWAEKRHPLSAWLVEELNSKYLVPQKLAQKWVAEDHILPLLDGLDEVKMEYRAECVVAINIYRRVHNVLPMVVCCRKEDYEVLGNKTRLLVQQAIVVQPLSARQIDDYLTRGGEQFAAIRALLRKDSDLQEMATTPLMLDVLTQAYAGRPLDQLAKIRTPERRRQQVFTTYVDRMLHKPGAKTPYTPEQTIHWLSWLATNMRAHNQSIFHLERMQPTWLATKLQKLAFAVLVKGNVGLLIGLIGWLVFTLYSTLDLFLYVVLASGLPTALGNVPSYFSYQASHHMFIDGLRFGVFSAVIYIMLNRMPSEIKPAEKISWSWKNIWQRLGRSHVVWIGLLFGLLGGLFFNRLGSELELGMISARQIAFGALLFIFGGFLFRALSQVIDTLPGNEQRGQPLPDGAIRDSLRNRVWLGLISGLVIGFLFGAVVGLLIWLVAGLNALNNGNTYIGQLHVVLWTAFLYGLVSAVLIGVIGGLAIASTRQVEIRFGPIKLLARVWQHLNKSEVLVQMIVIGLIVGPLYGIKKREWSGSLPAGISNGVVYGLLGGLAFCLFSVLVEGLSSKRMEEQALVRPNQGIRRSARNSVLIGLFFLIPAWLIFGIVQGLTWTTDWHVNTGVGLIGGLALALLIALLISLPNGGIACIQHGILRLLLWQAGAIPRRYRVFLDHTAKRILLRRVGGGYIFIHRLLLEHFASLSITQPVAAIQTNIAEVCTSDYQYDQRGGVSCPCSGEPAIPHREKPLQDSSSLSGFQRSTREHRWQSQAFHFFSPLIRACLILLIALPVVSWNVWTWSHASYPPPRWHRAFDDPLARNSNLSWGEDTDQNGDCRFAKGGYRIRAKKQYAEEYCTANTKFSDFAIEVQMWIAKHGEGGLIFRDDIKSNSFYEFRIEGGKNLDYAAAYSLSLYKQNVWVKNLVSDSNGTIQADPNQPNTIAVVARGNSFELYVNHWHLITIPDPEYSLHGGQIGLVADEYEKDATSTEVVFRNVQVWAP